MQIKKLIFILLLPLTLFSTDIYKKNEWRALLHYDGKFHIEDKQFYLSNHRDLKSELLATIENFKKHPSLQCKFPARKLFIEHELGLKFKDVECKSFETYLKKAPARDLYLIFASENIKNPTSMMGHTFFKISGKINNQEVSHAITFYTVVNSINPIKLLIQNLHTGMKGIFSLQPYKKVLNNYLYNENRNVWELKLKLQEYRKKLIYYHFWELKDIKMKYYFVSYNCSDIIFYCLQLAKPNIKKSLWVTPIDVIKIAKENNLIEKIDLIPSNDYLIFILEDNVKRNNLYKILDFINKKPLDYKWSKVELLILKSYIDLLYEHKKISKKKYLKLKKIINEKKINPIKIDISNYKSPLNLPKERSLALSLKRINNNSFLKLSFLPASHFLNDYNKDYSGENELKLFYISLLFNKNRVLLDEFSLYSMYVLAPYEPLLNLNSYRFSLVIKRIKNTTFILDGGIGKDLKFSDINIYGLINFGLWYDKTPYLVGYPEIGCLINEVFNMKSYAYYKDIITSNGNRYKIFGIKQNFFIDKNSALFINYENIDETNNFEFGYEIKF